MSYGHADKLLAAPGAAIPRDSTGRIEPRRPNPEIWDEPPMRAILDARDITALYRALNDRGISQHHIAKLTGQKQSEVCEILKGRRVQNVTVLERIADGLGIPRSYIRLPASASAYDEDAPPSGGAEEIEDDMLRRDVLAKGSVALVGVPVLGKLLTSSAGPGDMALPSQVGMSDVAEIKNTTEQLRVAARTLGGQARAVSAAAAQYGRLTQVPPASEAVTTRLFSQLAELNELAGWCCFDSGMDRRARWHYREAVDLAHRVGDHYRMASAMRCAGLVDWWRDRPDDALKQFDLAQLLLGAQGQGDPDLMAWLHSVSAMALADMDHPAAIDRLTLAQDGWQLSHAFERADQNYQTALVHYAMGHLDTAERFASTVNGAGRVRPVGVFATVLRATIHVHAGEPGGLLMAKTAIGAVAPLHSVRARERLQPLIAALETRPSSDHRDLARTARTVINARPIPT